MDIRNENNAIFSVTLEHFSETSEAVICGLNSELVQLLKKNIGVFTSLKSAKKNFFSVEKCYIYNISFTNILNHLLNIGLNSKAMDYDPKTKNFMIILQYQK